MSVHNTHRTNKRSARSGSASGLPVFNLNALTLCLLSLGLGSAAEVRAERIHFPAEHIEDIGDETRSIDGLHVSNNVIATITGEGGTLIYNGGDLTLGANGANTVATLDMSGLSNFVFDNTTAEFVVSGLRRNGAANSTDQSHAVVNLAGQTNTINASTLGIGNIGRNVSGPGINSGTLRMGQNNIFNVDSLKIGTSQARGTLQFSPDVADGTLKLRGSNGVDAVSTVDIATGITSNYSNATGLFDTTAGTLDARIDTLTIASARYGSKAANGTLAMGAGQLEANTIRLGVSDRSSGNGATNATLNISNGGVVSVNNLEMGHIVGSGSLTSRVFVESGAMLRAGTIQAGSGNGARLIPLNDGILANLKAGDNLHSAISIALGGIGTLFAEGAASTLLIDGVVSGTGALVKTGEGTLDLTASNTFSGGTQIQEGVLAFNSGANLGSGSVTLDGGTLQWKSGNLTDLSDRLVMGDHGGAIDSNGNDLTFSNGITGAESVLVKKGEGRLTLTGDNTWNGTTWIEKGQVQIGDGGTTGSLLGNIVNNSALILNRADVLVLTGNVSGTGDIIKQGTGEAVITGDITSAGNVRVETGELHIGDGGTRGNLLSDTVLSAGTALKVNRVDAALLNGVISGEGRFEQVGAGTTILSGENTWTGGTTISNGTLQIGNNGNSGSVTGNIVNNATLQFNRSDTFTVDNLISGTGNLVQAGSGTMTLRGDQTYTGKTEVVRGTLEIDGSVQSDTSISAAGTLTGQGHLYGNVINAGTLRPGTADTSTYRSLTLHGDYFGDNGVLALNTELTGDGAPTDKLILDGGHASGTTRVTITNTGLTEEYTTQDGIKIIDAINGATTDENAFRLAGDTRSGALSYRLFRGDLTGTEFESWYLRNQFIVDPVDPVDPIEPVDPVDPGEPENPGDGESGDTGETVKPGRPGTTLPTSPPPSVLPPGEYPVIGPVIATYGVVQPAAREMGLQTLGTRDKRSGDGAMMLRGDVSHGPSMWTRLIASDIDHSYQAFAAPKAKGSLSGLQIGADIWQGSILSGHMDSFGLYVAQSRASLSVSGLVTNEAGTRYERQNTGKVKLNGTSAGAYWTHTLPGQGYVDSVLQATRYRGTAQSESGRLDATGYGFTASVETGYPFALPALGSGFTLEPQAQYIWQETRFSDASDSQSKVALGKTQGSTARVGLRAKWTIDTASGNTVEPFASVNYWHDWNGRSEVVYDGKDRAPLLSSAGRISTDIGVRSTLTTNLSVHGSLGYQTGVSSSSLEKRDAYSAGLGLRYTF